MVRAPAARPDWPQQSPAQRRPELGLEPPAVLLPTPPPPHPSLWAAGAHRRGAEGWLASAEFAPGNTAPGRSRVWGGGQPGTRLWVLTQPPARARQAWVRAGAPAHSVLAPSTSHLIPVTSGCPPDASGPRALMVGWDHGPLSRMPCPLWVV